ncbi:MAG: hypothetical protein ACRCY3_06955 [Sphingorhabdus sp.]
MAGQIAKCNLLLAVQALAVNKAGMSLIPIFALLLVPDPPIPINDTQMADIGCVATLARISVEQKKGGWADYPPIAASGRRWAGIVGDRIVEATGQPRELVAMAMMEAAKSEVQQDEAIELLRKRVDLCTLRMQADLAATDAATAPLPKPQTGR